MKMWFSFLVRSVGARHTDAPLAELHDLRLNGISSSSDKASFQPLQSIVTHQTSPKEGHTQRTALCPACS